ncbi:hypothetical protein HNQ50_001423 [Silvimonas terrae]|uniref:Uncharacterized protein n=1 Tax=Silvimonas terrae TaxID=300266 RepID=A0A840REL8_9NEIS|nr:hypothetical protein [Silvimonas terrae]MBB5190701.1 hypothetical protein [Silvimonas terrae]
MDPTLAAGLISGIGSAAGGGPSSAQSSMSSTLNHSFGDNWAVNFSGTQTTAQTSGIPGSSDSGGMGSLGASLMSPMNIALIGGALVLVVVLAKKFKK